MDRVILHCDLNAFFASVEAVYRPELNDGPMAVCGNPENRHGIILAKNEQAKAYGVKTAETVWQARKKCPDLVLVSPHHNRYRIYSQKVNEIYHRFTDQVEPFGIDESWLDVTGSLGLFGDGPAIAHSIRRTVKQELGLTVSVGVSFNKIFAKLGSDYKKPDAVTVISREDFPKIVFPLPVSDLLYVGKATAEKLASFGIKTIGQLAQTDAAILEALLGKHGEQLFLYANGLDTDPVKTEDEMAGVKSVGNGMTFRRNLVGWEDIKTGTLALAETVAGRLRRYGLKCCGLQVTLKDPDFKTIDRQKQLAKPTWLTQEIYENALDLIARSWNVKNPIRLLTVTGIRLVDAENGEQLDLFDHRRRNKLEALDQSVDRIRQKYGIGILQRAAIMQNDLGIREREDEPEEEREE